MNENMRRQIMGASQAASAAPAKDEDARFEQNVSKAKDAAMLLFYDENVHADLMNEIPEGEEAAGVASVAADLISAVDDRSGGGMPEDVIFPAAMEVAYEIMDFMGEKGIHTFDEKEQAGVAVLLMKKLADIYHTTPEQMKEAMAEFQGMQGAPQYANQPVGNMAPANEQQGLMAKGMNNGQSVQ